MRPDYLSGLRETLRKMIKDKQEPHEILETLVDYVDESLEQARYEMKELKKEIKEEIRQHSHLDGKVVRPY